jgi:integrase/recombinase XerD
VPRRGERNARELPGDATDPLGMAALVRRYLHWLRVRHYSPRTVENREYYLGFFIAWAEPLGVTRPDAVTKAFLERYQEHVYDLVKRDGSRLSANSQVARMVPVRALFSWLCRQDLLRANPAADLDLPRVGRHLPKNLFSPTEVRKVLAQPDLTTSTGIRDRAILEVLYSSGIRRMELCGLKLNSIDAERGVVTVRKGKGNKDRVVPISMRALGWVKQYVDEQRPTPHDDFTDTLFLTVQGRSLTENRLTMLVREYIRAADIGKGGSCHAFRHSMATGMLENGADIRFIQAQLGHSELTTTQIYTRVSVRKLKEVHEATHPAADLDRADRETEDDDSEEARH